MAFQSISLFGVLGQLADRQDGLDSLRENLSAAHQERSI